jgi:xanthine dehydrogenase accessory factor
MAARRQARVAAHGRADLRREPAAAGIARAVRDDGILWGSVSGGCIEDDLVARRGEYAGPRPAFAAYGVTADEARRFGLPCGGEWRC